MLKFFSLINNYEIYMIKNVDSAFKLCLNNIDRVYSKIDINIKIIAASIFAAIALASTFILYKRYQVNKEQIALNKEENTLISSKIFNLTLSSLNLTKLESLSLKDMRDILIVQFLQSCIEQEIKIDSEGYHIRKSADQFRIQFMEQIPDLTTTLMSPGYLNRFIKLFNKNTNNEHLSASNLNINNSNFKEACSLWDTFRFFSLTGDKKFAEGKLRVSIVSLLKGQTLSYKEPPTNGMEESSIGDILVLQKWAEIPTRYMVVQMLKRNQIKEEWNSADDERLKFLKQISSFTKILQEEDFLKRLISEYNPKINQEIIEQNLSHTKQSLKNACDAWEEAIKIQNNTRNSMLKSAEQDLRKTLIELFSCNSGYQ